MANPTPELHPAQNRALRECYAFTRLTAQHWAAMAHRLGAGPGADELSAGSAAAGDLLEELSELTVSYGLHGRPAAQGVGSSLAALRNAVADRTLERNQALRTALLEMQHLTTLLAYLAALGESQGDERMAAFCGRWERKLKRHENATRRAAIGMAGQPDDAIAPADPTGLGRAGHTVASAAGTVGEWVDRRAGRRRS